MPILEKLTIRRDQTSAKVYFKISGEFKAEDITSILNLEPTDFHNIGDVISGIEYKDGSPVLYESAGWYYGTDYENTYDVGEQCIRVILPLTSKISEINYISKNYDCDIALILVPIIEKGQTPGLCLNKEVVNFCSAVNAYIDIDIYANPYDESELFVEVDPSRLIKRQ